MLLIVVVKVLAMCINKLKEKKIYKGLVKYLVLIHRLIMMHTF